MVVMRQSCDLDFVRPRSGLGPAADALATRPCRVAYVGNSVTVQRKGYRPLLHDRLVTHFGQPHRAINAGFGATGSMGSLYLLPDLVLRHRPDLCFIECTTGDIGIGASPERIEPVLEGMIRRLAAVGCAVAIVHLFRHDHSFDGTSPIVAAYERIAQHYQVPSINVARMIALLSPPQRSDICFDGVHLSAIGARYVADRIADAVIELCARPANSAAPPERYHHDSYVAAHVEPADPGMRSGPKPREELMFRSAYSFVEATSANEISFRTVSGPIDGMLLIVGPDSGYVRVTAGPVRFDLLTWDAWCTYHRLQAVIFSSPVANGTPMRIAPLDMPVPNAPAGLASRKRLRIAGFMVRGIDPRCAPPAPPHESR